MDVFPTITKKRQEFYEKIFSNHVELRDDIPCICGYYGRACRKMNEKTNSMLCNGCTLSVFISTVEAILECCNEKENIGINRLYDSDIHDIEEILKKKMIYVNYSYIEHILEYLIEN